MPARKKEPQGMRVVSRFVYNPGTTDRGLRAMADILAVSLRRGEEEEGDE